MTGTEIFKIDASQAEKFTKNKGENLDDPKCMLIQCTNSKENVYCTCMEAARDH